MALVLKDRVRESSSTSGTGTITLAGAATGFDSFASIGDGNTTYYAIIDALAGDWEVGLGTYTASGTTLSRDTVLESSNSDNLVNFAANTKDVICTYPADKSVFLSADGSLSLPGALSATGAVTGSNLNVSNWDTAYGWGNHASAGYLKSGTNVGYTAGSFTFNSASNQGLLTGAVTQRLLLGGGSSWTAAGGAYLSLEGADYTGVGLGGNASFHLSSGKNLKVNGHVVYHAGNFTDNHTNWNTAYGWGNHASAGYVVADGAVVINESGADVDFRIESNTSANAFFLEGSNGNVGIGTSNPQAKLEASDGSSAETIPLVLDNPIGGTDVATTGISFRAHTNREFARIVGGQKNNATFADGNLKFITRNNEVMTEAMRIDSSGNVGIGTASPSTKLDVNGAATIDGILLQNSVDRSGLLEINRLGSTGWTGTQVRFSSTALWSVMGNQTSFGIWDDYNSKWILQHAENAGISLYYGGSTRLTTTSSGVSVTGSLTASGDVTAYSDERLKENWKDLPEGFVANLAGVKSGTYNRIDLDGKQQVGVSAQSLQTVLPDAVIESNDTLAVNYGNAALASAIELAKKVVELEARIKELEVR